MGHYEEHLERDERDIRERTANVASAVEKALRDAVHALLTGNKALATETILGDGEINRATRELDKRCHAFIIRHLPSAGHLRLVSATIRAAIALERIGDYAVNISREAVQLSSTPEQGLSSTLEMMGKEAADMLSQAMEAFTESNAEKAKGTMGMADQMERHLNNVFAELTKEGHKESLKDLFALFVVFSQLERVSDQAKNLCEETVFVATGQTKAQKVYRLLFVDEINDCASQMAEAIGRKILGNSGIYESAGRTPAEQVDAGMVSFMSGHGFDLTGATPSLFDKTAAELAEYHIVISLQGPVSGFVPKAPFHTSLLEWDVGDAPEGLGTEEAQRRYEEMYRKISSRLRELMERLRGQGAD